MIMRNIGETQGIKIYLLRITSGIFSTAKSEKLSMRPELGQNNMLILQIITFFLARSVHSEKRENVTDSVSIPVSLPVSLPALP